MELVNQKAFNLIIKNNIISNMVSKKLSNYLLPTNKFESHKNFWFSYFRSYDITSEKQNLKFLSNQLKHRFNILIKISMSIK